MIKNIFILLIFFNGFNSFSQSKLTILDLVQRVDSLSKVANSYKIISNDKVGDCSLSYALFENVNLRNYRMASIHKRFNDTIPIWRCNSLSHYSIENLDSTVVMVKRTFNDLYEVYKLNEFNVPQYGFVFNSVGILVIEKKFVIDSSNVTEILYLADGKLTIDDIDLINLKPLESTNRITEISHPLENCFAFLFCN